MTVPLADVFANLGFEESLQLFQEVISICWSRLVLDVVGRVLSHAVEIVGTFHQRSLFGCEGWQTVTESGDH